ncbi:hypothetical protein [Oceanirhabdus sp. W0125-5]|uniref:hypothetical protein n=1 Tax=Oceanirhabdus sp. W0125-5 TaxID=2999116 RepID=UPI0022F2F308|nr:hypothetical protein [Oceanirhabdus sp. W0125-5]WBW95239.1 hypothetical protein OW730_16270 [Oceanirhabdus sp. W0125-5]
MVGTITSLDKFICCSCFVVGLSDDVFIKGIVEKVMQLLSLSKVSLWEIDWED